MSPIHRRHLKKHMKMRIVYDIYVTLITLGLCHVRHLSSADHDSAQVYKQHTPDTHRTHTGHPTHYMKPTRGGVVPNYCLIYRHIYNG